ncbi:MAG: hypothetical protein SOU51_01180 [Collinsella sp.]|nr:hypothetical protein [Collinsella sp.]
MDDQLKRDEAPEERDAAEMEPVSDDEAEEYSGARRHLHSVTAAIMGRPLTAAIVAVAVLSLIGWGVSVLLANSPAPIETRGSTPPSVKESKEGDETKTHKVAVTIGAEGWKAGDGSFEVVFSREDGDKVSSATVSPEQPATIELPDGAYSAAVGGSQSADGKTIWVVPQENRLVVDGADVELSIVAQRVDAESEQAIDKAIEALPEGQREAARTAAKAVQSGNTSPSPSAPKKPSAPSGSGSSSSSSKVWGIVKEAVYEQRWVDPVYEQRWVEAVTERVKVGVYYEHSDGSIFYDEASLEAHCFDTGNYAFSTMPLYEDRVVVPGHYESILVSEGHYETVKVSDAVYGWIEK